MFEDFQIKRVPVAENVTLRLRLGGSGPPVVLLHGHPRTHTTWHRVAPLLTGAGFTVVCPDLRGYGQSTAPGARSDHSQGSKREMARDIVTLMALLGHDRFAVAGHDRGSYVALRMAMDHPAVITHLAVLDSVPIGEALRRADATFAEAWWHWFFYAQPDLPERAILADPDAWYRTGPHRADQMGAGNYADFHSAVNNPDVVIAMLEDYRAGLGVDRADDDADRDDDRKLQCPTLVAWSTRDDMQRLYGDVLDVWRPWARDLTGLAINSGHHMAEDNPTDLAAAFADHFRSTSRD